MLSALLTNLTLYCRLIAFKCLLSEVTKRLDIYDLLKLLKCLLTFSTSFIVLRIAQAPLLIAACYYYLGIVKLNRGILIRKVRCVKENSVSLFTHRNCKLIHNSAVDLVKLILSELADKCHVYKIRTKTKGILEYKCGEYLYGC